MGFAKACIGTAVFAIVYVIERAVQLLIERLVRKTGGKAVENTRTDSAKQKNGGYVSQFKK